MKKDKKPREVKTGDNVNGLSDAQRQALHLSRHVPDYEKALAVKKKADNDFKNTCKVIKSEGGSVDQVKMTISLRTVEGEQAFRDNLAAMQEAAEWNGVGVQIDLEFNLRQPADDKAFDAGKRAGLAGESARAPYDPGTSQAKRWLEGHADGQAVLSAGFKPIDKAA